MDLWGRIINNFTKNLPEIIKISSDFDNMRIDNFLKKKFQKLSYVHLTKLIGSGSIRLNGKKVKPSFLIKNNDSISFPPKLLENFEINKQPNFFSEKDIELVRKSLIKEGDDWIAINKPQGIAVQGGSKVKSHIDGLLDFSFANYEKLYLVHRLDKDTTGSLLIAKNRLAAKRLTNAFRENKVKKMYLAIVNGKVEKNNGSISIPLIKKSINANEKVMPDLEKGLNALTYYYKIASKDNYSILALFPITGRTHQLRVHLNEIGHSIVGDNKYFSEKYKMNEKKIKTKLMLHCFQMYFPDKNNSLIKVEAKIPLKMISNLKKLKMDNYIKNIRNFFDYNLK